MYFDFFTGGAAIDKLVNRDRSQYTCIKSYIAWRETFRSTNGMKGVKILKPSNGLMVGANRNPDAI